MEDDPKKDFVWFISGFAVALATLFTLSWVMPLITK